MPNYGLLISGGIDSKVCQHMYPDATLFHYRTDADKDMSGPGVTTFDMRGAPNKANAMTAKTIELLADSALGLDNIIFGKQKGYDHLSTMDDAPEEGTNTLITPLSDMYKHEVIKYASENNIDLTDTVSCLTELTHTGCGVCYQCMERAHALSLLDSDGFDYSNVI